jgi:hypothetical protein
MSFSVYAVNTAWMLLCRAEWKRFVTSTKGVAHSQSIHLLDILKRNRDSNFGLRHGFASIDSIDQYQRRVPLMEDADLKLAVDEISLGSTNVLTCEPILLLQPTSGSTHATKLIPYTRSLRHEYQRMVAAWIGNLFWEVPQIRSGRAYWSISPAGEEHPPTPSGIRIGFDDDTAYLGLAERWMASRVLAVPSSIAKTLDIDRFRYLTLLYLLRTDDLSLISIWSPTYLSALLDQLSTLGDSLIRDIRDGTVLGARADAGSPKLRSPDGARAKQLARLLSDDQSSESRYIQIWPMLATISCWMDGSSRVSANRLRSQMGNIRFQAKGLLATEAAVSFPVVGTNGCALAIQSHFFEFIAYPQVDDRVYLADQLTVGAQYTVVVTTGGGLYRYPLHDVVEVTGRMNQCPLLRFVQRSNQTSDLVGEKLQEAFVQACIDHLLAEHRVVSSFVMLLAVGQGSTNEASSREGCHYRLQLETETQKIDSSRISRELDGLLQENIHYRYARQLGQLGAIAVEILPGPPGRAWIEYEKRQIDNKNVLGNIKPRILASGQI